MTFTEDEQAILATDRKALQLLAVWHHFRSGDADLDAQEAMKHEARSAELYEMAYAAGARRPKESA